MLSPNHALQSLNCLWRKQLLAGIDIYTRRDMFDDVKFSVLQQSICYLLVDEFFSFHFYFLLTR